MSAIYSVLSALCFAIATFGVAASASAQAWPPRDPAEEVGACNGTCAAPVDGLCAGADTCGTPATCDCIQNIAAQCKCRT